MSESDSSAAAERLARFLGEGRLDPQRALPALKEMLGPAAAGESLGDLAEDLYGREGEPFRNLQRHVFEIRRRAVLACRAAALGGKPRDPDWNRLIGDLPLEIAGRDWEPADYGLLARMEPLRGLMADAFFVQTHLGELGGIRSRVQERLKVALGETADSLERFGAPWILRLLNSLKQTGPAETSVPAEVLDALRQEIQGLQSRQLQAAPASDSGSPPAEWAALEALRSRASNVSSSAERRACLNAAAGWPTARAIPVWLELVSSDLDRERVLLQLALRFGDKAGATWEAGLGWLRRQQVQAAQLDQWFENCGPAQAAVLLWAWSEARGGLSPELRERLRESAARDLRPVRPADFVERWAGELTREEWNRIAPEGTVPVSPPPLPGMRPPPLPAPVAGEPQAPAQVTVARAAVEPAAPPRPTIWEAHVQPFLAENLWIVSGILMFIVGASVVAYFTWDKAWWVRYTFIPLMLGGFTASLAGIGGWLERQEDSFKGTAAILRGAAIGLLPVNFMTIAVLSADPDVAHRGAWVMLLGLVYLGSFGWGLARWCGAVAPALARNLAPTLLGINFLVILGPMATTLNVAAEGRLLFLLGAGFYVGFAGLAWAVVHFTRQVLDRGMAEANRVPWFVGGTLALTFLQVFAWVHGFIRHLPQAQTYAPMVILAGGLVLLVERRTLGLRERDTTHGGESFLGFACILLGLLMGAGHPWSRVLAFLLAGGVWLALAWGRTQRAHYWVGLTLMVLAGASLTLVPGFPVAWRGWAGLVLALGLRALGSRSGVEPHGRMLAEAARGLQTTVLAGSVVVAVLLQWHYRTVPLGTAFNLLGAAALMLHNGLQARRMAWVLSAQMVMAIALPYLGFMDLVGPSLRGNTLCFGLALLSIGWLLAARYAGHTLLRETRSMGLWFYGMLAVVALGVRVVLEQGLPVDPDWWRHTADYLGPLLMTAVLVVATYHSRSLGPALMAVVISIILVPELKENLKGTFIHRLWGSGLGSACSALALVGVCFRLRRWPFLQALEGGDTLPDGRPFPLRRTDATLFTWPLIASAVFLAAKVDAWNLWRNVYRDTVGWKTCLGVMLTGVIWTLLAVYFRRRSEARIAVHLGWMSAFAAVVLWNWRVATEWEWTWTFVIFGVLMQGLWAWYHFGLRPRHAWVDGLLTRPTLDVLRWGVPLAAMPCLAALVFGDLRAGLVLWCLFLVGQCVWHGGVTRRAVYGTVAFPLAWMGLLAWINPLHDGAWSQWIAGRGLWPTLIFLAGLHALLLLRERRVWKVLSGADPGLLRPAAVWAGLIVTLLALVGVGDAVDGIHDLAVTAPQLWALAGLLLVMARAHLSGWMLLLAFGVAYLAFHHAALDALPLSQRSGFLFEPLRWAVLALAMAGLTALGREGIRRGGEGWLGACPHPWFRAASRQWIHLPVTVLAVGAALHHTLDPVLRESPVQLLAPFAAMAALVVTGKESRRAWMFGLAALVLVLANLHTVRVFLGDVLRGRGLSELHLICLGLGLTLAQAALVRLKLPNRTEVVRVVNQSSLAIGGLILGLLCANYFIHPDLGAIPPFRFVVSGLLAWLAGRSFRRAAREPGPGEAPHVRLAESLYHFGIVLAIWCGAMLVPPLRTPAFALFALGLPVLYFFLQAETGFRKGREEAARYRDTAAVLGFVILALYTFRGVLQMVLFPGTPVETAHYHTNAPLMILLSLLLLRLHGLGGTGWLGVYGGLAMIGGSFFGLTWLPGLSPFTHPLAAAWCAVGLGHFWVVFCSRPSPVRTFIQHMGAVDGPLWFRLRQVWGVFLVVGVHVLALWGVVDPVTESQAVAPLALGTASLLIHQGIVRRFSTYLALAGLELAWALHADFFLPSLLPRAEVIWVLLGLWLVALAQHNLRRDLLPRVMMSRLALGLGGLTVLHVAYHGPASATGWWAVALAGLFTAWNPQAEREASVTEERLVRSIPLALPTWLVVFGCESVQSLGWPGLWHAWPVLSGGMTLFLTGGVARWFQVRLAASYEQWPRSEVRVFDQTATWMTRRGHDIHGVTLCAAVGLVLMVQALHYGVALEMRELFLVLLFHVGAVAAWVLRGREGTSSVPYYAIQLSALAFFVAVRRHLMLTQGDWNYEYDVWAALTVSFGLAGARRLFDLKPRHIRSPLTRTTIVLPVVAVLWVVVHGLGTDAALRVVLLYSLLFAHLGQEERESPYNAAAVLGFVAFALLTFWSKLEWRYVHAYVIPVGVGVLVLLQLFREQVAPGTRNRVRFVTLCAMIGSAGYYALMDPRHEIGFNLTLVVLCLLAMGLGSFLRVRLYLHLGFAGLLIALVSIVSKVLTHMERSSRMTVIGSLVLVLGAGLVFGAIYFKTHREALNQWLDRWRRRLGEWE